MKKDNLILIESSELEYFSYIRCIDYHISKLHIFVDELKSISGCQDIGSSLPSFKHLTNLIFQKVILFYFSVYIDLP